MTCPDRRVVRDHLRDDLLEARRANDTAMVSVIRTLMAAIDNAEAVDHIEVAQDFGRAPR